MVNTETIAKWGGELADIENRIVEAQGEIREQLKDARKEISFLRERAKRLVGLISGREHEQLPLPETPAANGDGEVLHHNSDIPGAKPIIRRVRAPVSLARACAIPGCGEPGKRSKGVPGLWCASHAKLLSVVEKMSIADRNKRLAAEGHAPAKRRRK